MSLGKSPDLAGCQFTHKRRHSCLPGSLPGEEQLNEGTNKATAGRAQQAGGGERLSVQPVARDTRGSIACALSHSTGRARCRTHASEGGRREGELPSAGPNTPQGPGLPSPAPGPHAKPGVPGRAGPGVRVTHGAGLAPPFSPSSGSVCLHRCLCPRPASACLPPPPPVPLPAGWASRAGPGALESGFLHAWFSCRSRQGSS